MSADSSSKEDVDEYETSSTNLPFLKFEHLAFESKLFEIVEELRLRRECDESNTTKIQQLIQKNFDMKKQQEISEKNFEKIKEEFEKYKLDMKKMYDCKLSVIEEEKISNQVTVDLLKKEMETIKNESWSLQMDKLNLEKTIMELKTHLHVRNNLQESTHDQFGEIQNMFDKLNRNCCKLSKMQKCLREDVHHATTLCERVEKLNTEYHEKLEFMKGENQKIKQEIVKLRSQLQEEYYAKSVQQENIEIENLKLKTKFQEQELLSLQQLLNQTKEESDNKFKSLEESNRSLNKYINLFNEANNEKRSLIQKLDKANLENKQLTEKIQELQEKLNENYRKLKEKDEVKSKNLNKEIQTITTRRINKLIQTTYEETEDDNDFNHIKQILFSKFEQKCNSSKNFFRNLSECKQNTLTSKEIILNDDYTIKSKKLFDDNEKLLNTEAESIEIEHDSNQSINLDVSTKLQNDSVTSTSDNTCKDDNNTEIKCSSSLNPTVPQSTDIQTELVKQEMQLIDINNKADKNNDSLLEYSTENGECSKSDSTVINSESVSPKRIKMNDLFNKFKSIPIDSQCKVNQTGNENLNLTNDDCGINYSKNIEECKLLIPIPSFINKEIPQLKETNKHKDSSSSDSHETDNNIIKEYENMESTDSDSNISLSSKKFCRNILGATSLLSVLREKSEFSGKRFLDNSLMKEWNPPMKKFNISLDNNSVK